MKVIFALLFGLIALSYEGTPIINNSPNFNPQPPVMNNCPGGICPPGGQGIYGGGGYPYPYPYPGMGYNPWLFDGFGPWDYDGWDYNNWDWDDYHYGTNKRNNHKHKNNQSTSTPNGNPTNSNTNSTRPKKKRRNTNTNPNTRTTTRTATPTRDILLGEGTMGFNPGTNNQGYINLGNGFMPFGASGRQSGSITPEIGENAIKRQGKNESPEQCKISGIYGQMCLKKEALPIKDEGGYIEYYDCFAESVCKFVKEECKWLQTKRFKQCINAYKQYVYDKQKHSDL